jgi:hypothetical protein
LGFQFWVGLGKNSGNCHDEQKQILNLSFVYYSALLSITMAPHKEVDTDHILNNPWKCTLAAIFTDKNNAAVQNGTFKYLKCVIISAIDRAHSDSPTPTPQASSSKPSGAQPPSTDSLPGPPNTTRSHSWSPSIKEVKDPDAIPKNRAPRNSR